MREQSISPRLYAAVLVVVVAAIYAVGVSNPLVFDDTGTVTTNQQIRSLRPAVALSPPPETPVGGRPLVNLSFALNYASGGLDVRGYRVVNIVLHAMAALLIFGIARRTLTVSSSAPLAFAIAMIWAVHPLNSEAVNYLTQRTELLMAVCYLLTMYAATRVRPGAGGRGWMFVAIAACAAGMACKESMVSAPVMVILLDRVYRFSSFRAAFRERRSLYLGLIATWSVLVVLMWTLPRTSAAGFASTHVSSWTYLLNQSQMIVRYLRLVVWPDALVLYYGWAPPITLAAVWAYMLVVVGLVGASLVLYVRSPKVGVLALWVFVTLAPTSSVVPIASEVGAERRMYLPLVGIVALVVVGVAGVAGRQRWRQAAALGLAAAAALGYRTVTRTTEYASPLGLAQTVLERWPTPSAHYMVGTELVTAGRTTEATSHLRLAAAAIPPAGFNLGAVLLSQGQTLEGIAVLERFLRDEPRLISSRDARLLLARAYQESGRLGDAIIVAQQALDIDPNDAAAHGLKAEGLASMSRFAEAIPHFEAYLRLQTNDAGGWTGLGIAMMSVGRFAEGVSAFQRAVALSPGSAEYQSNLARALIQSGRSAAAR